jgi:putative membrane protein
MLAFPSLPWLELARSSRQRYTRAAVVAVLILPLVYGVLYTWSNWNPNGNLDQVRAAVVNLDKPVTVTGTDGKKQLVPLGRVVAGNLTGSTAGDNFTWVLTDQSDAKQGLADGTYGAVVTIPPAFSAAATSTGAAPGTTPAQATLNVRTNDAQNYLSGGIARSIGAATTTAVNSLVTETYLNNLYVGFSTLHDQLGEASGGARALADGAGSLAGGAQQADQGAGALVVGLKQLANGTRALPAQSAQLNNGAQQLASGATRLAGGAGELSTGLAQLRSGTANLPAQAGQLDAGAQQLATGAGQLAAGAKDVATGAGNVAAGTGFVSASLDAYATQVQVLASTCAASGANPAYCAALSQAATGVTPLAKTVTDLGSGARFVQAGSAQVADGAGQLKSGATMLSQGTSALVTAAPRLSGGISAAAQGAQQVSAGATSLSGGADQLATGTRQLAAAAPQLSSGISQAATGAGRLRDGTGQLADGASQLSSGSRTLATGLEAGAEQVPTYTKAERATLAKVAATPVVSDIERINAVQGNGSGVAPYFMALALWVGAMAVYLLLRALSARALASTASSAKVALAGYLPGAVLTGIQAILLVAVLHFAVGLDAARPLMLLLVAVLTGLTFAALNQALIAAFGGAGRFFALIFVGLQLASAGATYPIETAPGIVRVLHDALPLTYAVDGLRAALAGGADLAKPAAILLLWLVLGLLVTLLATAKQRTWSMARLRRPTPA